MPAEHLRALIKELHPDVTVRQLTLAAGLDPNRIAYYLKPSTDLEQMPRTSVLKEIARALQCDLALVVEAFAADLGLPWGANDGQEASLLRRFRQFNHVGRASVLRMVNSSDERLLLFRYRQLDRDAQQTLQKVTLSMGAHRNPHPPGQEPSE